MIRQAYLNMKVMSMVVVASALILCAQANDSPLREAEPDMPTVNISMGTQPCSDIYYIKKNELKIFNFFEDQNYNNNMNCLFIFKSPPGTQVVLQLVDVEIQPGAANCEYDNVQVYSYSRGAMSLIDKVCGTMARSPALVSQRNIALMTFFSDKTVTGKGFKLEVFSKKYDAHYHSHYFSHGYYPYPHVHHYAPYPHAPCDNPAECNNVPWSAVHPHYDAPYPWWQHYGKTHSNDQYAPVTRYQYPAYPAAPSYQPQQAYAAPPLQSYGSYNDVEVDHRYSSPIRPSLSWKRETSEEAASEEVESNERYSQQIPSPPVPATEEQ